MPVEAIRSKNVRQARNSSSRPPAGRVADARAGRAATGSIQRRSASSGTWVASISATLVAGRRRVVGLEQAGPRADHLAERPERDALAVGRGAAVVPPDAFDDAVDVLQELPGQPALADPGLAGDRHEPGALLAGGGVEQVLEQAQLLVATDERRLEPVAPAQALALADDAQRDARRPPAAALPLRTWSPAGSKAIAPDAARWVASPTSTVPGAATDWRREAVLTRSPATIPWPTRAERDRGLAGEDAGPCLQPGREAAHRLDQLERGADGPLGVVLVGDRRAPDGHHRVADELLDRAAVAVDRSSRAISK